MPWLVAACLAITLALTPLAACGMSVGDEQSTWGGQGPAPLVATPTAESSGDGKAP
ncbi:MAG: hypothetical protein OXG79_02440 [Chloroflexi bacterium]|nr:hypothetical protein [Chloroflexota bacterium]